MSTKDTLRRYAYGALVATSYFVCRWWVWFSDLADATVRDETLCSHGLYRYRCPEHRG